MANALPQDTSPVLYHIVQGTWTALAMTIQKCINLQRVAGGGGVMPKSPQDKEYRCQKNSAPKSTVPKSQSTCSILQDSNRAVQKFPRNSILIGSGLSPKAQGRNVPSKFCEPLLFHGQIQCQSFYWVHKTNGSYLMLRV